jgi:hypothetical protein
MLRAILGWLIIAHAFAHASAGIWSATQGTMWIATAVWTVAFLALLCAGLGLLRVPGLRRMWHATLIAGCVASGFMILWYRPPLGMIGIALDLAIVILALGDLSGRFDSDIAVVEKLGSDAFRHPWAVRAGWGLGIVALTYATVVMVMRPVFVQWGSTPEERTIALAGDEVHPRDATYRIDHAITIHAPVAATWPWLVQLGQDRGGFYSYDWLERSFGVQIKNADRIHPEWQQRAVGDTIRATQASYLGGRFGAFGWKVNVLEPERVIGLENWGTFVLVPIDSSTTRLIVRTRGAGGSNALGLVFGPIDVFVFEPAHFIMEQAMLRGIRDRAERSWRS